MKRIVEVKCGDNWQRCQFKDLRKGDIFRLYDPPEMTPVLDNDGCHILEAMTDPSPYKGNPDNLGIETEGVCNESV